MASEQPELLFFDTFSHETSEKLQEEDYSADGERNPGESTPIKNLKTEENYSCTRPIVSSQPNEECPSSMELKKDVVFNRQDEYIITIEDIGTSDHDLCEFEISGITEAFKYLRDLWIPSDSTERALALKIPYSHFPDKALLTFPEICEDELKSKLSQFMSTMGELGTTSCTTSCMQNVSQDQHGLMELVKNEAFSSAVNLTAWLLVGNKMNLIKNNEPLHPSPQSIQWWFTRLALLVKMQEYKIAEIEAYHWGNCDKPDLYYQFYPDVYQGRSGSMVPFQMRMLLANLPSHCGRHSESLKKLFSILSTVRKILQNVEIEAANQPELESLDFTAAKRLWYAREKRVLISIVNVSLKMKEFILPVEILSGMLTNEKDKAKKKTLYSILGRIHLMFGDLTSADKFFSMAQPKGTSLNYKLQDFHNVVDFGLLALARNDFQEAYQYFEKASFIEPSSAMVMNNCAVCLFYLGHLQEGIRLLSGAVNNDPLHALHDCLILNLCTMYELSSGHCRANKMELLKFTTLFKGDLINVSSFRLYQ